MPVEQNRRTFFRWAGIALISGGIFLWDKMVGTGRKLSTPISITVPYDPDRKFTYHRDFIIVHRRDELYVLSSRCTHLGCRIGTADDNKFLCPCHGSVFNEEGTAEKGPALEPLRKLSYVLDEANNQITVLL